MPATAIRPQAKPSEGEIALAAMQAAEATNMRVQKPVIIGDLPHKYVFRSAPGKRLGAKIRFDYYQSRWDDPDDLPELRRYAVSAKANWMRRNSPEMQQALRDAYAELGTEKITFRTHVTPTGRVVSYATDSDAVAMVIRDAIRRGLLPHIDEVSKGNDKVLRVGEKLFANTPVGRDMAMAESDRTGESIIPEKKVV
jgi:hypothetical protein